MSLCLSLSLRFRVSVLAPVPPVWVPPPTHLCPLGALEPQSPSGIFLCVCRAVTSDRPRRSSAFSSENTGRGEALDLQPRGLRSKCTQIASPPPQLLKVTTTSDRVVSLRLQLATSPEQSRTTDAGFHRYTF